MKKLIITSAIAVLSLAAMAQDKKVAVFDPAGSVNSDIKEIVREIISSGFVNAGGGYIVLERSLIDKVLEENKFQTGGLVDDSQISEIGKRMGANLVFVSNVTALGNNYFISGKLIDVQTARIDKQKTTETQRGTNDLIDVVQKMVGEMFGSGATTVVMPTVRNDNSGGNIPQTAVSSSSSSSSSSNIATVSRRNGETYNPDGIELIYVERTVGIVGTVATSGFYIGKFEITQAQWLAIMGYNPSYHKGTGDLNLPVENVSWDELESFLLRLNLHTGKKYRLPTVDEWRYAARGGNQGKGYTYSGSGNINDVAWYKKNSNKRTQPVGTKDPNELGIYDMSGNVSECIEPYVEHFKGTERKYSPLFGGRANNNAGKCNIIKNKARSEYCNILKNRYIGFRVVLPE